MRCIVVPISFERYLNLKIISLRIWYDLMGRNRDGMNAHGLGIGWILVRVGGLKPFWRVLIFPSYSRLKICSDSIGFLERALGGLIELVLLNGIKFTV